MTVIIKLTIITINLNNANGLRKTMDSVFDQTFLDFEYLVVDGKSTDDSISVIQSFDASRLHSFIWISEPDSGIFNAMNKGIAMANGEYLLFLNSGDFLINNNVVINLVNNDLNADILYGRSIITDGTKKIHLTDPPKTLRFSHFYNATIAHQATFIRRTLFEQYGQYREDLKFMSDWEFWIRTVIKGEATTAKLDLLISDYNLCGISSDNNNLLSMQAECKLVYKEAGLSRIVPDYDLWAKERNDMRIMYWAKSKVIVYNFIRFLFWIAKQFTQKRK